MYKELLRNEGTLLTGKSRVLASERGPIVVEGPVASEYLSEMTIDQGLKTFRPASRQLEALVGIAAMPLGRVIIARSSDMVVGYVTFHPAEKFERWGQGDLEEVIELGAVEVSPAWRGCGVAKGLLDVAFNTDYFEDYIVVATEYYWHWDLEGTGQTVWEYRKMMERLLEHYGFRREATDDPEITCHPANMLAVRRGGRVAPEALAKFEALKYKKELSF